MAGVWLAAGLCLWLMAAPAAAGRQESEAPAERRGPGQPDFRTGVDLVSLTVTVTDRERRFVQGLRAGDFVVLEDGVPQPVTFFGVESVPLDLALLVDSSSSMRDELEIVRDAAAGLLRLLRAGDRASLVEFRQGVRVAEALTHDLGKVSTALQGIRPGGATSLYNALYITLKEFQRRSIEDGDIRRRAIVVLSDGEDTTSMLSFEDVLEQAKRSGVAIYTISLRASAGLPPDILENQRSTMEADYAMRALAYDTGGRAFFPKASRELKAIYGDVGQELAAQYALGYMPSNAMRDGTWRRVAVRVTTRPDVRPRTRSGYYAPSVRPLARRGW